MSGSGAVPAAPAAAMVAVGAVSERRVRLWLRSDAPGPFTVEVRESGGNGSAASRYASVADSRAPAEDDGTLAFTLPDDASSIGPLVPATQYGYRITVSGTGDLVGEGRFETAPPERESGSNGGGFAFAFMSCHQPFLPDGSVHPDSARMLDALIPALEERGVKYLLFIGDQIYADAPEPRRRLIRADTARPSLVDAPVEPIRARYQARYRQFWALPQVRQLQARWPAWYIWDDHEIVDDWGTLPRHTLPEWQRVYAGARAAYIDYQASRALTFEASPSPLLAVQKEQPTQPFHQSFVWGCSATFIMDLCSQRQFLGRDVSMSDVYGGDQFVALSAFLRANRERPAVFVVLSVPSVYLPDWVVGLGERVPGQGDVFASRWNAARNRQSLDLLLDLLRAHWQLAAPYQKLTLLSGDVHEGAAVALHWPDMEDRPVYQFVSSPVTNALRDWREHVARRLSFSLSHVRYGAERLRVERLSGTAPGHRNPFGGLNVGVVHVTNDTDIGAAIRFELITFDERNGANAARTAYDSGSLP